MSEVTIRITPPAARLKSAFGNLNTERFIRGELLKIAYNVQRFARQLTPVDTGRLRATIGVAQQVNGLGAVVSTNMEYAIYVHEGTRYMRARPFMERGAEMAKLNLEGQVAARLDQEYVRAFKSL